MTQLNRQAISEKIALLPNIRQFHAGWFQSYALDEWPQGNQAGSAKQRAIERLTRCEPDAFYVAAYARWKKLGKRVDFEQVELPLETRLYIGVTRDNALETGISVSHSYGMPIIPGSSIKGLTRAWAESLKQVSGGALDDETLNWLFGEGGDAGETGGLIFHDAWWVPEGRPFVEDIVTPHQKGYYGSEGQKPPSDFEDPIPAPQIAVQGKFLFTVEGDLPWVAMGRQLMVSALNRFGIGSKTTSGYGYFTKP